MSSKFNPTYLKVIVCLNTDIFVHFLWFHWQC